MKALQYLLKVPHCSTVNNQHLSELWYHRTEKYPFFLYAKINSLFILLSWRNNCFKEMLQICLPRLGKRDSDLPTTWDNMIQNGRGTLSQWIYPNPQLIEDFLRFLGQLLHRKDFSFFPPPPPLLMSVWTSSISIYCSSFTCNAPPWGPDSNFSLTCTHQGGFSLLLLCTCSSAVRNKQWE